MSIIIGAGTLVNFDNKACCVVSVNWGYNPNTQRLYCIGSWTPQYTFNKPIQTLSISMYSCSNPILYSTAPSVSCTDANTIYAKVVPAFCGTTVDEISGDWFVTGYGFSKDDPLLPGQENWSMQLWVASSTVPKPSYVLRGITEGSAAKETDDAEPGIIFSGTTVKSSSGSVSAGGIGRADIITTGVVSQVGGSEYPAAGKMGRGDASIPYTPLWI